jgi:hypothetical protein
MNVLKHINKYSAPICAYLRLFAAACGYLRLLAAENRKNQ